MHVIAEEDAEQSFVDRSGKSKVAKLSDKSVQDQSLRKTLSASINSDSEEPV